jgi:hypothetical protein
MTEPRYFVCDGTCAGNELGDCSHDRVIRWGVWSTGKFAGWVQRLNGLRYEAWAGSKLEARRKAKAMGVGYEARVLEGYGT